MDKDNIKKLICYMVLGVVFLLTIIYMGNLCIKQKQQEEKFVIQMKELEEEVAEKQKEVLENERVVLVDTLPVFELDDISLNKDVEENLVLVRGEHVVLEQVGYPYSLIKNKEGTILGYVWNDCIGEERELAYGNSKVIVIDAGHQGKADKGQEPVGPNADKTKDRVLSGTDGTVSKRPEHEMVLDIALELERELKMRGYHVVQVRRDADARISNAERAILANQINADVLIRLHGNGADDSSTNGADAYHISEDNPYVTENIYNECKKLAECVLDAYTEENPDIKKNRVHESDIYTGLNWCEVPSVILEMGYLSNEKDDRYLNDEENLGSIAEGIADGIDIYFYNIEE